MTINASLVPAALPVLTREGCASGPLLMPTMRRRSVRSVSLVLLLEDPRTDLMADEALACLQRP